MEKNKKKKSGRKELDSDQRKGHIQLYVENFKINALDGRDKLTQKISEFIEKCYAEYLETQKTIKK